MLSRPRIAFAVGVVAVSIVVAGFAAWDDARAPTPPAPTPAPTAALVAATVEQTTAFQARGLLEALFQNGGREPFVITSLRLVDDRFEVVEPTARDTVVEPGPRRLMIPIPYGTPRCPAVASRAAPALEVVGPDGERVLVEVDAAGEVLLGRLHHGGCEQQRIRDTVELSFGPPFDDPAPAAVSLSLRVERRRAGEAVTVTGMRGTVIFALAGVDPDAPVVELAADEQAAATAVELSASRCDPHALIESKKTYRFPIWVSVGDRPPQYLELEPEGEARRLLEAAVQAGCFGR